MDWGNLFEPAAANGVTSHKALTRLSGLSASQVAGFRRAWSDVDIERRQVLTRELVELTEDNVELEFNDLFLAILDDPSSDVRLSAIEGLWEDDRRSTAHVLLELARRDPNLAVRAAAAGSIGRWLLALELGTLDTRWGHPLAEATIGLVTDPTTPAEVSRRALEAVSYLSYSVVPELIRHAYAAADVHSRASSLLAMGRTGDVTWYPLLYAGLSCQEPELRYEAARAIGELGDRRAVPALIELASDRDHEIQLAAIGSLGHIGGRAAQAALQSLLAGAADADQEPIEDALEESRGNDDPLGVRIGEVGLN